MFDLRGHLHLCSVLSWLICIKGISLSSNPIICLCLFLCRFYGFSSEGNTEPTVEVISTMGYLLLIFLYSKSQ